MGHIAKWTDAVTNRIVGGKKKDAYSRVENGMSDEEKARLDEIEKHVTDLYSQQDPNADVSALFKQHLLDFASKDFGPNPSPEQMEQATSFIDQVYTNPAQAALKTQQGDIESQNQALAASMGRNGNLDASTRAAIANAQMRGQLDLNQQRGSLIGNTALDFNNRAYLRAGDQLNALGSGSNFLNNLTQQSLNNKLALLNARSNIGNVYQNERFQNRITGGGGTSSGILTNISAIRDGVENVSGIQSGRGLVGGILGNSNWNPNGSAGPSANASGGGFNMMGGASSMGGMMFSGGGAMGGMSAAGGGGMMGGAAMGGGAAAGAGGGSAMGAGMGAGALAALSDKRAKKNINSSDDQVKGFLSKLKPSSFEYKDPKHGDGTQYGVMAQDLEKSDMGKSLVFEDGEGKKVDLSKATLALLASNAHLSKRLENLEKGKKS